MHVNVAHGTIMKLVKLYNWRKKNPQCYLFSHPNTLLHARKYWLTEKIVTPDVGFKGTNNQISLKSAAQWWNDFN